MKCANEGAPVGKAAESSDLKAGEYNLPHHVPKLTSCSSFDSPVSAGYTGAASKPTVSLTTERYIVDNADADDSELEPSQATSSSFLLAAFLPPSDLHQSNSPSHNAPTEDSSSVELPSAATENEAKSAPTTTLTQPAASPNIIETMPVTITTPSDAHALDTESATVLVPKKHRKPASAEEAAELQSVLAAAQLEKFSPALIAAGHDTCADVNGLSSDALLATGFKKAHCLKLARALRNHESSAALLAAAPAIAIAPAAPTPSTPAIAAAAAAAATPPSSTFPPSPPRAERLQEAKKEFAEVLKAHSAAKASARQRAAYQEHAAAAAAAAEAAAQADFVSATQRGAVSTAAPDSAAATAETVPSVWGRSGAGSGSGDSGGGGDVACGFSDLLTGGRGAQQGNKPPSEVAAAELSTLLAKGGSLSPEKVARVKQLMEAHKNDRSINESVVETKVYTNGTYTGEFLHGLKHGAGTYRYKSTSTPSGTGEVYTGRWLNGTKHGWGTYTFADGSVYEGSWLHDLRHGPGGTMREANGGVFRGEYRKGRRLKGTYEWPPTAVSAAATTTASAEDSSVVAVVDTYDGEWQDGQPHGEGTMVTAQGVYTGGWSAGKKHGEGTFKGTNGDTHRGEYRNNRPNGLGHWVSGTTGEKYVGEYSRGMRNGQGLLTKSDGTVIHAGAFRNGLPDIKKSEESQTITRGFTL